MRKQNPNDVVDDYQELVRASLANWQAVCTALDRNLKLKKQASADAFLTAAVGWESFISDWHIAAINRDPSNFSSSLTAQVTSQLRVGFPGLVTEGLVTITMPQHPTVDVVRSLVDPDGGNLPIGRDKKAWRKRAKGELADPYRARVYALSDADHCLIQAVAAIRNCIAHRSVKSKTAMNARLDALHPSDRELRRPGGKDVWPTGIGHYLQAQISTWQSRVAVFHDRLEQIAEQLRV